MLLHRMHLEEEAHVVAQLLPVVEVWRLQPTAGHHLQQISTEMLCSSSDKHAALAKGDTGMETGNTPGRLKHSVAADTAAQAAVPPLLAGGRHPVLEPLPRRGVMAATTDQKSAGLTLDRPTPTRPAT